MHTMQIILQGCLLALATLTVFSVLFVIGWIRASTNLQRARLRDEEAILRRHGMTPDTYRVEAVQ